MRRVLNIIFLVIIVLGTCYCYYLTKQNKLMLQHNTECVNQVNVLDSLLNKCTRERDSILAKIDTTEAKVVYVKEKYKEEYINILDQSIIDDMEFFSNYLLSEMHD